MNLRPSSKSCCMIWNPARLRRKSSLLHFHAILTDLQEHTSILRYNRTPGSKMRFFQWNVSCCSSRCPFHSVSTTINICSSAEKCNRCRVNEHPGVQPNLTPACCVHFLRRAGGGAGVPVIYDGNALIMHLMPFLFSFWFIYDQIHWKVICRSWFQLSFFSYLIPPCFSLHPKDEMTQISCII